MTVGAIEAHLYELYENLANVLKIHGKVLTVADHPMVANHIKRRTDLKNGSWIEIVPGQSQPLTDLILIKFTLMRFELMEPSVFQESRNIAS